MENFAEELNASDFNPMTGAVEFQSLADKHNIPADHPMRQIMAKAQTPEQFAAAQQKLRNALANNIAQQRALAQQGGKDTAHMERTKAEVAGRQRVAEINAAAHKAAAESRGQKDQATLQAELVKALRKVKMAETPADKAAAMKEAEELWQMLQVYKISGAQQQAVVSPEGGLKYVTPQPSPLPGGAPTRLKFDAQGNPVQ
jgi:hypothetical protein